MVWKLLAIRSTFFVFTSQDRQEMMMKVWCYSSVRYEKGRVDIQRCIIKEKPILTSKHLPDSQTGIVYLKDMGRNEENRKCWIPLVIPQRKETLTSRLIAGIIRKTVRVTEPSFDWRSGAPFWRTAPDVVQHAHQASVVAQYTCWPYSICTVNMYTVRLLNSSNVMFFFYLFFILF